MQTMKHGFPPRRLRAQSGVMLIEAMLAILIFSIGVLGLIGLQAAATKASTDARYRSEAALLAQELIGRMWAGTRTFAAISDLYSDPATCSSCTATEYKKWAWEGLAAAPGTQAAPGSGTVLAMLPMAINSPPTVRVTEVPSSLPPTYPAADRISTSTVTITVFWQVPGENERRNYTTTAQIGG